MSVEGKIKKLREVRLDYGFEDCEKLSEVLELAQELLSKYGDAGVFLDAGYNNITTYLRHYTEESEGEYQARMAQLNNKEQYERRLLAELQAKYGSA